MSWWGKVIGGTLGFMAGGPLGALMGAAIGHNFDSGLSHNLNSGFNFNNQEQIQSAFFTATFSVMGCIAKADGQVSQQEIDMARSVMAKMQLNAEQQRAAMELFQQGKQDTFPLNDVIDQFKQVCVNRQTLLRMFLEIQLLAAFADGNFDTNEQHLLQNISRRLGFSQQEFNHIEALIRQQQHFAGSVHSSGNPAQLNQAYQVLAVDKNSDDKEVKKAYRRLMSQHHPDKLVSKGLPEEMIELATERTKEIRSAYETIQAARKSQQ